MDTKSMRQKILDLAIRGKLVPQDPTDEPASVLLERIRAEKQQMVKDGKLKAKDIKDDSIIFKGEDNLHYEKMSDGTVKCIEEEIPFEIPENWCWARIGTVCILNPRNELTDDMEVSFIPMTLVSDGFANNHKKEIRKWQSVKSGFTHFQENDVGIAKITPCFENRKSVVLCNLKNGVGAGSTELHIVRSIGGLISSYYLLWFVKTENFIINGVRAFSGAVGQQRVGKDYIATTLLPLPPFAEQLRIVTAIGDAFEYITAIEDNKYSLKSIISQAKSKILDLAIRGKLVPQDPADESASVLLERIRAEKEQLIKAGKIKRDKNESYIFRGDDKSYYEKVGDSVRNIDDEIPFDVPVTWGFVRLDAAMPYEQPQPYIVTSTEYDASYPTPVLTAGKSFIIGYTNETDGIKTDLPTVIFDDFTTDSKYVNFPFKVKSSAMKILTADSSFADIKFYYYVMQKIECTHSTHKRYWISDFSQKIVPLPPLQEQKRIVAVIEAMEQRLATIMGNLN